MKTDDELILIADFLGKRKYPKEQLKDGREQQWDLPFCDGYWPSVATMKFQTSWDWLMPAVEKIAKIPTGAGDTFYPRTFGMIDPNEGFMVRFNQRQLFASHDLIKAVYAAVVDFIKYYNSQSKQT